MRLSTTILIPALLLALALSVWAAEDRATDHRATTPSSAMPYEEASTMQIRLIIDGKVLTASLADNATARDFVALLPLTLTLTLEDYASTEKSLAAEKALHRKGACRVRSRRGRHHLLRTVGKPSDLPSGLRLLDGSHQARPPGWRRCPPVPA